MKYPIATDGQWIQPIRRGYKMGCCDCGLIHKLNFRLKKRSSDRGMFIQFQAFRDVRATAAKRRAKKVSRRG